VSTRNDVLAAWLAHDERPSAEHEARKLLAAEETLATELGISTVAIRRARHEGRRAGLAHDTILDRITS
jgi:hypothetical protein